MKKHSLLKAAALTTAAYTLCLHGRTRHPDLEILRKYRFAHRGYHDKPTIPENSMPAFRRAVERGWGAELDVHLMKDGTLAVIHDSRACSASSPLTPPQSLLCGSCAPASAAVNSPRIS